MLNNVVGLYSGYLYLGGLYSGGLIFGWAYIWNEVSVSICGGLIFLGGAYIRGGGLIVGGLRYTRVSYLIRCDRGIWSDVGTTALVTLIALLVVQHDA
jgi:hypothetical protein